MKNKEYMQSRKNAHPNVTLIIFVINILSIKMKEKTGKCTPMWTLMIFTTKGVRASTASTSSATEVRKSERACFNKLTCPDLFGSNRERKSGVRKCEEPKSERYLRLTPYALRLTPYACVQHSTCSQSSSPDSTCMVTWPIW